MKCFYGIRCRLVSTVVLPLIRRFSTEDGVPPAEYASRRDAFLSMMEPNSIVLLPAADETVFSHDILYPFRQDSLFYHLFGLSTPLRRSLAPPTSSVVTTDVTATVAVFVRPPLPLAAQTRPFVLLFAPGPVTDPAVSVWASTNDVQEQVRRLLPRFAHENRGQHVITWRDTVYLRNDVAHVVAVLTAYVEGMARASLRSAYERQVDNPDQMITLPLLPKLYVKLPQQLRYTSTRYRLPPPEGTTAEHASKLAQGMFDHPLDVLVSMLCACRYELRCSGKECGLAFAAPQSSTNSTASADVLWFTKAKCFYEPPAASTACRALGSSLSAQQDNLRSAFPALLRRTIDLSYTSTDSGPMPSPANTKEDTTENKEKDNQVPCVAQRMLLADPLLWRYREVKSPGQVWQHFLSADATLDAFVCAMQTAATTRSEHAVHCAFNLSLLKTGARLGAAAAVRPAYIPVVASGVRALEIHYTDNNNNNSNNSKDDHTCASSHDSQSADTPLLLRMDAGAEVFQVPCDCTRTFPLASSRFTRPQRTLYEALLALQRRLLRAIRTGVTSSVVAKMHVDDTRTTLLQLGVGTGAAAEQDPLPLHMVYNMFCPHSFGHLMGLDLHEQQMGCPRRTSLCFRGGMMHTVEPGLYLPDTSRAALFKYDIARIPEELRGLAVQIEDDVLILPPSKEDHEVPEKAEMQGQTRVKSPSWPRAAYLAVALRARAKSISITHACHGRRLASVLAQLPKHHAVPLAFLQEQRISIDGAAHAEATLARDVEDTQRCFTCEDVRSGDPWIEDAHYSRVCDWYPYDIVVLTARIPKEVVHIERVMNDLV